MRALFAIAALPAVLSTAGPAEASHVWYYGKRADAFIARRLPGAATPGPINQAFAYGRGRHGSASCKVPAMGARSDGAVSVCYVKF